MDEILSTPRPDELSESKRMIMEVAAKLFADKGYGSVGISEVGDAAGFGKGALYYHIKSKEELLFDIMTVYMVELINAARTIEISGASVPERIRALSHSFMEIMFASRPEMTVCFREVHALNDVKRKGVLGLHADYQDIWMRVFHDGARQGVLRALSKIEIKAILGMYFYSFLWIKGDGAMTIDAIAEDFTGITLRAAGKG
ncbi:TetR/AcrR family transcriptional regulator [Shinella sumterensis]|uniref:TetR/AcrR family transcriptional regulator n=1 Tax=Shinella sumterensis TaxID=1967501 RepID=UPI003F84DB4D